MKIVAKPLEMVCWFKSDGVHPSRFRLTDENGEQQVIKITAITGKCKEKLDGITYLRFICKIVIGSVEKPAEVLYNLADTKWVLYKI